MSAIRIGQGFDAHRLVEGRPLVIGGVAIPHDRGLQGDSDADVLLHAIADALLGAAGLGDLGAHFPPGAPECQGLDSSVIVERVCRLIQERGWRAAQIDATVVAQKPRLAGHLAAMKARVAGLGGLAPEAVNIKAKSTDGMGFTGRGEGIAALVVVLLEGIQR